MNIPVSLWKGFFMIMTVLRGSLARRLKVNCLDTSAHTAANPTIPFPSEPWAIKWEISVKTHSISPPFIHYFDINGGATNMQLSSGSKRELGQKSLSHFARKKVIYRYNDFPLFVASWSRHSCQNVVSIQPVCLINVTLSATIIHWYLQLHQLSWGSPNCAHLRPWLPRLFITEAFSHYFTECY